MLVLLTKVAFKYPLIWLHFKQRCSGGFGYQVCEKPKECFVQDSTHDIKRHVQGLPRSAPWFVGSTGKELQFSLDCLAACAQVLGQ
jgi:hypothetical protein